MAVEVKKDLESFSRRSKVGTISKFYDYNGKLERARLEVGLFNNYLSIQINKRTINDLDKKEDDLFSYVTIPLDVAETIFNLVYDNIDKIEDGKNITIPIHKNDKETKDTVHLCDLIVGLSNNSYYMGVKFPQRTSIKFILVPYTSVKQWYITINGNTLDTLSVSKAYTKTYFKRLINYVSNMRSAYDKVLNQAYPVKIKERPKREEKKIQASPDLEDMPEVTKDTSKDVNTSSDFDLEGF